MGQQCSSCNQKKELEDAPGESDVKAIAEEAQALAAEMTIAEAEAKKRKGSKEPKEPRETQWVLPPGGKLNVMMFGMTGAGKSALGNLIAGQDIFDSGDDTASVTNLDSIMRYEADDGSLVVLDTIGLGDTEIDQSKVVASIRDVALSAPNGVDCLLYVMRNARITDDAISRLIYVTEYLWGDESLLNLYIVVTYASKYANNRLEADDWIQRQVEINWRFKHIYSIVGSNPRRFIFVDNPDLESLEPRVEERRRQSRESLYKLFWHHPREAVPPFTQAMMKQVAELTKVEREELEKKEKQLRGLEASAKPKAKKTSVTGVVPAELKKSNSLENSQSQNLQQAKEDYKKAQLAMQVRLKEVKSNKEFQAAAQEHAERATDRFMNDFKGDTEKAKAATRMLSSLSKRLSFNSQAAAKAKSTAKPKAKADPAMSQDEQLKVILNKVRKANKETPPALFRSLGGWSGAGAISPMVFTTFLLKHVPDITQQQIGALWWRADTNNDGQVDLNEFKDFFAKYVETAGTD
ncbi:GTPase IMAP family member 4 (Immunity-associated nucleotide 1 protein) (IAN-1) (hIAN1) (Immunity-associated protein 4) [Durusdinium trenchii]|uniref:GTPase IMAP family member 4 (Immunity-associated nucleotide 1 protein) (IAN-1) (HIAN1) (Immunity-associated protein 4) n=1 Tax=Durusdinium trenchii TaxID=1381693 RepID=A0ABP0NI24_9DINO